MDSINIPDIYRIMSVSYQTIDTFSTWCEDLEVHFNSSATEFPSRKIRDIMKRLTEYRPNTVIPKMNSLFYLLAETVFSVVGSQETLPNVPKSIGQIIRNKLQKLTSSAGSILPIQTFDEASIHRHYKGVKQLKKLVEEHQKTYRELQKQQEICWIAKSKVTKYELCLLTAKKSRSYLADKLPLKELESRDNAIDQLQDLLERKVQKAADASRNYKTFLDREQMIRSSMKKVESKIVDDMMFGLTERVHSGLSSIKQILAAKTNQKSSMLLTHVKNVESECRCLASSVIDSLSSKYKYGIPQEFYEQNGFNIRLPDCHVIYYKDILRKLKTETGKQRKDQPSSNNNNENCSELNYNFNNNKRLHPESLIENTSACFIKLTQGMTVKQKIATESSDVVFGWYKLKPWQQKRWAFFQKNMEASLSV